MDAKLSAKSNFATRATNSLLLNASFIDNLGLMHGKMGISILIYHLTGKCTTSDYGSIFKLFIQ